MYSDDPAKTATSNLAAEPSMSADRNTSNRALSDDWRAQRRETRRLLRQLPPVLQREVRRAYRSDIRQSVLEEIHDRVLDIARARGVARTVASGNIMRGGIEHVPAFHKRAILDNLATNKDYVRHVHRTIDERLRTAHLAKLEPDPVVMVRQRASSSGSDAEPGHFESDQGLGTASALDEAPDQLYVDVAQLIAGARADVDLTLGNDVMSAERARCLVLDPRGGALARAATAVGVTDGVQIQEAGPEFVATALPGVLIGRTGRIRPATFDYAVWAVPAPAWPGAANQIQAYRQSPEQDLRELSYRVGTDVVCVRAPSSLGPRRWTVSVAIILSRVVGAALKPGGTAILRFPQAVRTSARYRPGIGAKHGYDALPGLANPLIDALPAFGFDVLETSIGVDRDPVKQPFAGSDRHPWTMVKARRRGA
jgi:hypothetical protein